MGLPKATRYQSAVRLLSILVAASESVENSSWGADVVAVLDSQMKLQALDFWMRNPDYLANELLNEYKRTSKPELLEQAVNIVNSKEPDLRRFPMIRYHFGAFEPLDDALALLRSHDFIRIQRIASGKNKIRNHIYLLTSKGKEAMDKIENLGEELRWYTQRARLVNVIAGGSAGKALKDRQYLQKEYASTNLGDFIPPITKKVISRITELQGGK